MSFFGFDTSLPRDRGHSSNAPGFGQHDAFAGLSSGGAADDDAYVARQKSQTFPLTHKQTASTSRRRTMALATTSMMPTMPSMTILLAALPSSSPLTSTLTSLARHPRSPTSCRRSRCFSRLDKAPSSSISRPFLKPQSPIGLVTRAIKTPNTSLNWRHAQISGASSLSSMPLKTSMSLNLLLPPHRRHHREN
jgi:hypothetical protein